jgi:hypothetical protein
MLAERGVTCTACSEKEQLVKTESDPGHAQKLRLKKKPGFVAEIVLGSVVLAAELPPCCSARCGRVFTCLLSRTISRNSRTCLER